MVALDKRRIFPTSVVAVVAVVFVRWLSSRSIARPIDRSECKDHLRERLPDVPLRSSRNLRGRISIRPSVGRSEKCAFVAAGAVDTGAILTSDLEWPRPTDRVEVSPGPRVNTLFRER